MLEDTSSLIHEVFRIEKCKRAETRRKYAYLGNSAESKLSYTSQIQISEQRTSHGGGIRHRSIITK
jgi:hypothetical protein